MNDWYEQWSKGGAGPNFRVEKPDEYIKYFNWFPNWVNIYFFNKVSDFLYGIIFITIIVLSIFFSRKKVKVEKKINLNLILILLLILLFEWFYNHPALRYGGYVLIGLIIFIPLAKKIEQYKNSFDQVSKKIYFLIILVFIIFLARNVTRIFKEVDQYHYKPLKNVYYHVDKNHFRINSYILDIIFQTDFYQTILSKKEKYCVIHLRGGDKMVHKSNKKHLLWNNNSIHEDEYVDQLLQQLDDSYQNILLLSDTISLLDKCYSKLKDKPYTIYMTNNTKQNENKGLHKIKDIYKSQINQEMLTDFYFMIQADKIISDNYSAFSNICKSITY
mgnify:CR=1 FL=1